MANLNPSPADIQHDITNIGKDDSAKNSTTSKINDVESLSSENRPLAKWYHWHEPGTSPEEKRLILKIDFFLLSISCLIFFIKQVDGNNVNNAYVSGMSEELNMGPGDELSWMNTYFSIGTIVGGTFANMIITIIKPRYWLSLCLMIWSVFVLAMYKCNTAPQMYVLRFFIGLFESAVWPGVMWCLGSWYRKSELARRSGLFVMSGVVGGMFSGYLQAALYTGMNGKQGLSAWRWLFIFDFILAIPVAFYAFFCHPDTPDKTEAWYFTEWEKARALERMEEDGRKPTGKLDWTVLRRTFGTWQVYAFTLGYSFWCLTCGSFVLQYFSLYLKATGRFSVPQINNIPTALGAVNFVTMISTGYIADKIGNRWPVCLTVGLIMTFNYAVLTVWNVPHTLRMVAFILHGVYGCFTPLLAGWTNECCGGDQQKRALVLGFMVSVGQAVVIPFQQIQMPSGSAPEFKKTHGWGSSLAWVVILTIWTGFCIPILQKRYGKGKADSISESADETSEP